MSAAVYLNAENAVFFRYAILFISGYFQTVHAFLGRGPDTNENSSTAFPRKNQKRCTAVFLCSLWFIYVSMAYRIRHFSRCAGIYRRSLRISQRSVWRSPHWLLRPWRKNLRQSALHRILSALRRQPLPYRAVWPRAGLQWWPAYWGLW